ncbi:PREDICTED: uncharacterized protein LOC105571162 [Vollenhovia emeryi]|uniref:uncharacterized protein LOC105571162 n=1 Tax=Vollenhovia emeryi TaxID=411798 RepID=UPI0005F4F702|nr:PREDICTED: uncharacterized protein LOC105571162 [Vollenhovia emeryi]
MTDPTERIPTHPRVTAPPAKPPLLGVTPNRPPGSKATTTDAERFWRTVISRRIRNNPEMLRRGVAGPRRPPEDIPAVELSEEEDPPRVNTVSSSSSSRATGPTVRLIEVMAPHTIILKRAPGARGSSVSAAGAAAPRPAEIETARPTAHPRIPRMIHAPADTTPGLAPAIRDARSSPVSSGGGGTLPRMPRDPFCIRPPPREERDVQVDGCLIRVPVGVKRWRTRIGKIKYALCLVPETGTVRHWSKRQLP